LNRYLAHIVLLLLLSFPGRAQEPDFYLGFDQILDNREYFTEYATHQTYFGVRINPGVSFGFDSMHSINLGVNYMYEFGGEWLGVKPQIDLFYSFSAEKFQVKLGSFPRKEVMEYPLFSLADSLQYYRPNVEGASIRYNWEWGSFHGWVDWMGRENDTTREAIHAGFDATINLGLAYLSATTTRYHLARTTSPADNNQIRDDGSLMILAGIDLSDRVFLTKLNMASGVASTYLRQRPDPSFTWSHAWYTSIDLRYRIFGIKGSYYLGGPSALLLGDPLYSSGNYGRIDFFVDPFKNPRISSKIGWNLHMIPGDGLYHSQQILVSVML
jgi:hypothetical protein